MGVGGVESEPATTVGEFPRSGPRARQWRVPVVAEGLLW